MANVFGIISKISKIKLNKKFNLKLITLRFPTPKKSHRWQKENIISQKVWIVLPQLNDILLLSKEMLNRKMIVSGSKQPFNKGNNNPALHADFTIEISFTHKYSWDDGKIVCSDRSFWSNQRISPPPNAAQIPRLLPSRRSRDDHRSLRQCCPLFHLFK